MWRRISLVLLNVFVCATLAASGVAHGVFTDRWLISSTPATPALENLPMTIEDWDGTSADVDPHVQARLGGGEVLLRGYVNRVSGAAVSVFLTTGRAGPIVSSHRPESCYRGAGYDFAAPVVEQAISVGQGGKPQQFQVLNFSKTERASPMHVRLFWSLSANGKWLVPESPRVAFAGQRRVYKLYVTRQLAQVREPLEDDPARAFLQVLVPELEKTFFAAASPDAR